MAVRGKDASGSQVLRIAAEVRVGLGGSIPSLGKRPANKTELRRSKQPLEVAVEALEELVHVEHVVGRDGRPTRGRWLRGRWLVVDVLLAEAAQGELGFARVAVAEDGSDEVASVALDALDDHHPHVGLAGEDLDVLGREVAMADAAALHPVEDDPLDLLL